MKLARLAISGLSLLVLLVSAAHARIPLVERVPANSIIAVGIDNTAATWKKIDALPLTVAITNYLTTGSMLNDLDYQSFLLEQQKLGEKLGYPATPGEMMSHIFSSLTVYAVQTQGSTEPVGVTAIAAVKDKAKAAKLIEVINERVSAANPATSDSTSQSPSLQKMKIAGVDAWHFADDEKHLYYGLTGHGLVIGDNLNAVTAAMADKAPATPSLTSNAQYNRLRQAINWDQADVSIWYDADAVIAMEPQVAGMLKGLAGKTNKYAITFNVARDGVIGRSVTGTDPAPGISSEQISMAGLKMVAASPLFAADYGLFDAKDIVKQLKQFETSMGAMGGMGGMDIGSKISAFEEATSISLQNELAPALGTELLVAVNNFTPNTGGLIPNIDLIFGAKIRNTKLMKQVMTKFEKSIETQMSNSMASEPGASPTFQTATLNGMAIRTLKIQTGVAAIAPSYSIHNGYLIMGISPESIQAAGARMQGKQPALDKSRAYAELRRIAGGEARPFSFSVLDANHIAQKVVKPFLPLVAGNMGVDMQNAFAIIDQIVAHVSTFASMDARQEGLTRSYIKLQMQ